MYVPGAIAKSALLTGKNPALKIALAGYLSLLSELPIFVPFGSGWTMVSA
jgi:hypothetical protein